MDGRGFGSGYSSWSGGGSGSRGSGGFDSYGGGFKDSVSGFGGYGGGGHMKRGLSGASLLSSTGTDADTVIAKINQRLDMLSQLEGGMKGSRGDRFDQYESFDSRPSAFNSPRDLFRSGGSNYGYDDGRGDNMLMGQRGASGFGGGFGLGGGGGFDSPSSSYGVARMRQNMRDSFTSGQGGVSGGGGWPGAGRRSPRRGSAGGRGAGGGFGSRRSDPTPMGGSGRGGGGGQSHRGHSPGGGRGKLPSLLSNRMYPDSGGFHQGSIQGPHDFPGRHFGGGPRASHQRGRKRSLNKSKPQREDQKKRKQTPTEGDEPESKINKTDGEEAEGTQEQAEKNGDDNEAKDEAGEPKAPAAGEKAESKEDDSKAKKKPQGKQTSPQSQERVPKVKRRKGFLERVMYACSVCKFRSFYKEEMEAHLESRFHKEHFRFLSSQLSKPITDFLQEYLINKFKKTEQRYNMLSNPTAAICQVYREQDLTRELSMDHFMKKVEAAHCAACDVFIPMQNHLIQKHIRTPDHNHNRKAMMEQSKRASLVVTRSILNHKLIGKKLESYLKGENPFIDDQDQEDSMVMDVSEIESDHQKEAAATAEDKPAPEGEESKEETEGDVTEEKMEEEQQQLGVEGEEKEEEGKGEKENNGEEQENKEEQGSEEGFVVRGEREDQPYDVYDIGEEGVLAELEEEEDEGIEATEIEEEEKNDE
ncbi:A-kinase anchor protein 8-like isoform X2 [Thalassophryne amazonica]|uniref:A-kinase anchor protein 8-like isoform X2 n=1 Tax=Thalassophryne amazonica TaxID=390379 RepID=UPI001470ADEA|nr:A-kinase anchor protein 8-like isoform X2 [Thalassophryne amazonica]